MSTDDLLRYLVEDGTTVLIGPTGEPDMHGTIIASLTRPGPEAGGHESQGIDMTVRAALDLAVDDAVNQGWLKKP